MTMMAAAPLGERILDLVVEPAERVWHELALRAPALGSALALLFGLWLVAKLARAATVRLLRLTKLDAATRDTFLGRILSGLSEGLTPSKAMGSLVYAAILLLAVSAASEIVGLSAVRAAVGAVLAYLPRLVGGLVVLAIGGYVAGAARRAVGSVLRELKSPYAGVAETAAETVILMLTVTMAVDALGADLSFVTQNLMLILGVLVVTAAFLFGWSMRRPAEEIIANYYLRRMVRTGDKLTFNSVEGTVEKFTALGLLIKDDSGDEHFVPARHVLNGLSRTPSAPLVRPPQK